ncbi:CrcB protein [Sphingomonas vulcanisoli]|uniref:Fluoride-specific ion channel FluC n=1 Tax=Sphingomonas vulcanisoli TaxID=1658060 RepID=A0ABX0TS17_9SPHN|nr:fluoride efflux transporter CrcB [Sphingomonas vulcanisoli]NIJ08308.1 CrcB protein [Sphingomonas vulcanisoli]
MPAVPPLILVMLGGALGAGFRYNIGVVALRNLGADFPYATLMINILGGFLMGVLAGSLARPPLTGPNAEPLRLFLGIGVLGGFTTFSSFSLETVNMLNRGAPVLAAGYALASVIGSVLALYAGLLAVRLMA